MLRVSGGLSVCAVLIGGGALPATRILCPGGEQVIPPIGATLLPKVDELPWIAVIPRIHEFTPICPPLFVPWVGMVRMTTAVSGLIEPRFPMQASFPVS